MIEVRRLQPASAGDAALVDRLAAMVNAVYAVAEAGLFVAGTTRTSPAELAGVIAAGELVVAERDGLLAGCVHLHDVAADVSQFGMLAAAPAARGTGVGRALLDHVEADADARGLRAVQLELLVPRGWEHPTKAFLKGWYGRRGYRQVRTTTFERDYPHLAPRLATPCDLEIHQRPAARAPG